MKKILITGATGYLGSRVIQDLWERRQSTSEEFEIIGMDVREVPEDRKKEGVSYIQGDIRSPEVPGIFKNHGVNLVVHLASIVTPGKKSDRDFEYSVDVEGTENILKGCIEAGVEKIIISSSGAAYGYYADNAEGLTERDPLRGNFEFAYSYHKRLVEEMLERYRKEHPSLKQVIFRIGTILGENTRNQITALFEKKRLIAIKGSKTPFVFIWDKDVSGAIQHGIFTDKEGIYNVAGDGALSIYEIAEILGKKTITLPPWLIKTALFFLKLFGLSQYGPEQVRFLQYRPVLLNTQLKEEFGYLPKKTSREVFLYYLGCRAKL